MQSHKVCLEHLVILEGKRQMGQKPGTGWKRGLLTRGRQLNVQNNEKIRFFMGEWRGKMKAS